MTYTEAAANNAKYNLTIFFRDPKKLCDGVNLRWVRDPDGMIGYVVGSQIGTGDVLIMYPVRVLKNHVQLQHKLHPMATWPQFEILKEG